MYNRYLFPNYYDYIKSSSVKNSVTPQETLADKKFTFPENLVNALKLMQQAVAGESEDRAFYSYLIDKAPDEEEKQIITGIRDNEIGHYNLFNQIYFEVTGEMVPKQIQEEFTPPATYCEGLKLALLGEQGLEHCARVVDRESDTDRHQERHVLEADDPVLMHFALTDHVEVAERERRREEQRDVDEQHLVPAHVVANHHGRKNQDRENAHQDVVEVRGEMEKRFRLDTER